MVALWTGCRERFGGAGNFLFGRFSIPDAFYAPVVMRFETYDVKLPPVAQAYCEAVRALAAVREWVEARAPRDGVRRRRRALRKG